MARDEGATSLTVYAAIAANVAIAITKFIAAALAGSAALFSEGLHSTVDTGDGLLLLLGMRLARRPPSKSHPYGHGRDTYFWSMVVAMSIFGMGGVVSIYEGILHISENKMPTHPYWTYGTLGAAFVFEGISWMLSLHGFRRERGRHGVWSGIKHSKDPTTFVVVLEDSAALLGIVTAATGITLARWLNVPAFDGGASIVIGLLLVVTGGILGRETWSLLIGEAASDAVVESIRTIARSQPGVVEARRPRTSHLGPDQVHVDLELAIADDALAVETTRKIEEAVRQAHPEVHRVSFRFPASLEAGH